VDPKLLKTFLQAAAEIGVPVGERESLLFSKYYESLRLWNQKMNLISVKEDADIPLKHFLDALTPVCFLPRTKLSILDIGSGPGLPGIPMKIAVDSWQVSLLEASRKRTSFMKDTLRQLGLQNISVIHDRAEKVMEQDRYRQSFDVVISRATFKLRQLIETAGIFLKNGGRLLAMKGAIPDEECAEGMQVCETNEILYEITHEVRLPFSNTPRKIIIYKKLN